VPAFQAGTIHLMLWRQLSRNRLAIGEADEF
jgi:hypothetical protein